MAIQNSLAFSAAQEDTSSNRVSKPVTTATFIKKLFKLVTEEPDELVRWTHGGMAFEVVDQKRFEREVLPKFFRHTKFKSFARQLCFYRFRNISQGKRSWVYQHEYFRAGNPELSEYIRRRTSNAKHVTPPAHLLRPPVITPPANILCTPKQGPLQANLENASPLSLSQKTDEERARINQAHSFRLASLLGDKRQAGDLLRAKKVMTDPSRPSLKIEIPSIAVELLDSARQQRQPQVPGGLYIDPAGQLRDAVGTPLSSPNFFLPLPATSLPQRAVGTPPISLAATSVAASSAISSGTMTTPSTFSTSNPSLLSDLKSVSESCFGALWPEKEEEMFDSVLKELLIDEEDLSPSLAGCGGDVTGLLEGSSWGEPLSPLKPNASAEALGWLEAEA